MPRDPLPAVIPDGAVGPHPPACLCAECRAEVTRPEWAIAVDGDHERAFFNPFGRVFRVVCFREAPGVVDATPPSDEFSWFPGYAWVIVHCRNCGAHLGWRFAGAGAPPVFFGLIKPMLTTGGPRLS